MTTNKLSTVISIVSGAIILIFAAFAIGANVGWERHDFYSKQVECKYKKVQELPVWCLEYLD